MPRAQVSSRLRHVVFEGGHSESESGSSSSLRVLQPLLLSSDSSTGIQEDFQQDLESLGPWMWCACSLSRELNLDIIPLSSDWVSTSFWMGSRSETTSMMRDVVMPSKPQGCAMSVVALVSSVCLWMCNSDAVLELCSLAIVKSSPSSSSSF